jgi:hypothetical protein
MVTGTTVNQVGLFIVEYLSQALHCFTEIIQHVLYEILCVCFFHAVGYTKLYQDCP